MPISRRQFDQVAGEAIESTQDRILEFLAQNRQSAYTPQEILEGIFPGTVVDPITDSRQFFVEAALDSLLSKKAIEGKMITDTGHGHPVLYFACT